MPYTTRQEECFRNALRNLPRSMVSNIVIALYATATAVGEVAAEKAISA
jgi:hypothetical protein